MNELTIKQNRNDYMPGETIEGTIHWQLDKPPQNICLQIGWQTEGRGIEDNRVEYEKNFVTDFLTGAETFRFKLPLSPYSFFGKLIELNWFIEAYTKKGNIQANAKIVVAPERVPVTL